MPKAKLPTFKPSPDRPHMLPAIAVVPLYRGADVFNVFMTGGCENPKQWMRGSLDGETTFDSFAEVLAAAERRDSYVVRRADHFLVIVRGGLFDPAPDA
jgi:hypothetical protein